jgi:hypothetical protein
LSSSVQAFISKAFLSYVTTSVEVTLVDHEMNFTSSAMLPIVVCSLR